jgi:hypothetical protein
MSSFPLESLLAQFAEMPQFLAAACARLPRDMLLAQPRNDVSPLAEHAWHLHDCETLLFVQRIDAMLQCDDPALEPVFVKEWIVAHSYFTRPVHDAVTGFAAARGAFVERLRAFTPEELARPGRRADGHSCTVGGIVEEMAAHDRDHRQRICAILADYAAYGVPTPDAAALRT